MFKRFLSDNRAAEFSEVALVLAVVVLVAIAGYQVLGGQINDLVRRVAGMLG